MNKTNIALIGMMGVFKTSAGKILAQKLGADFVDTDVLLEQEYTKKVFELLQNNESEFRACEHLVVKKAAGLKNTVISCGGGVALFKNNVDELKKTCVIALLTADAQAILERVQGSDDRPLLRGENKLEKITQIYSAREAKYLAAADFVIDDTLLSSAETAQKIFQTALKELKNNL